MTFELRILDRDDLAAMRALNTLFGRAFDEIETYTAEPPDDAYLKAWLARPHVVAIAAFAQGEVVGGLVAYQLEKFERARSEFYIYDLAVAAGHRRRGIASACIRRLQAIAAERGSSAIFVQADRPDRPAIALYEKYGTAEDVLHFDIPVRRE